MPGEVIDVVLRVPTNPKMSSNQYKFEHANGTIKATRLAEAVARRGYRLPGSWLSRRTGVAGLSFVRP